MGSVRKKRDSKQRKVWRTLATTILLFSILSSFITRSFVLNTTTNLIMVILSLVITISLLRIFYFNIKKIDSYKAKKWKEFSRLKAFAFSLGAFLLLFCSSWLSLRLPAYLYTATIGEHQTIKTTAIKKYFIIPRKFSYFGLKISSIDSFLFRYPLTIENYDALTKKRFNIDLLVVKSELGFIVDTEVLKCYECRRNN
jgi:hypothetical protein